MVEEERQALALAESDYDETKRQLNHSLNQVGHEKQHFNQYLESLIDNLRRVQNDIDDHFNMPVNVLEEMRNESRSLFDRAENEIENELMANQHTFSMKQEHYEKTIRDELMREYKNESRHNFR